MLPPPEIFPVKSSSPDAPELRYIVVPEVSERLFGIVKLPLRVRESKPVSYAVEVEL